MTKRGRLYRAGILFFACALLASSALAAPWINMGVKDDFAFDQPGVTFEVFQQLANDAKGTSIGPSDGDGFFFVTNRFILDTGAGSIIAMNDAESELRSNGYVSENTVLEQGVSGFEELDVSASYYLEARFDNGFVNAMPNSRIMSGQFPDLFGINGIVGMPGMVGKVVTLDTSNWANVQDIFDIEPMKANMNNAIPASSGHRYSVPITARLFALTGDPPLPTLSPIPTLHMGVGSDNLRANGNFVLDTGAAISFISSAMAKAIGLDSNHDNQLGSGDERFSDTVPIGGIGGTIDAPLFAIDRIIVPTDQGVDLVWQLDQSLSIAIVDIDPSIDGVLGADLLTSGWFTFTEEGDFESTIGPIQQSHFDFRQFAQDGDTGKIYFDLSPSFDVLQPDNPAGDFNGDGAVNAADFVTLRKNGTPQDYDTWRSQFGMPGGASADSLASVPEPASLILAAMTACGLAMHRKRSVIRSARS